MQLAEFLGLIEKVIPKLFSTEVFIALIAAYIGARATSKATTKAHNYSVDKSKRDELETTQNTLKLIKVELTSAWEIYYSEYGADLLNLPDGEPCVDIFPIGENPFPIYDSAPSCLANINPQLSAKIIRSYMRAKGLIAMIALNNSECKLVFSAGRNATQKLANQAIIEGTIVNEEFTRKLDEYHDYYANLEARKLRMDQTAAAMKLLTIELRDIISIIAEEIDSIANTSP